MRQTVHLDVLKTDILKQIQIASPCSMAWEDMRGDDKRRHCDVCDLDVHNLEAMTQAEVEKLVLGANGRVCALIRRRLDNTIITRDCPIGIAAVRDRTRRILARTVAFASFLVTASLLYAQNEPDPWGRGKLIQLQPFKWAHDRLAAPVTFRTAGAIALPPNPTPGTTPVYAPAPPAPAPSAPPAPAPSAPSAPSAPDTCDEPKLPLTS